MELIKDMLENYLRIRMNSARAPGAFRELQVPW